MLEHHVVVTVCLTVLMSIVHCVSLSKKALRFFHKTALLCQGSCHHRPVVNMVFKCNYDLSLRFNKCFS